MVECRCEVLNNLMGDGARDYANGHLDEVRDDGQGRRYLRCPESGLGWVDERAPAAYGPDQRRLRRTDRT